MSDKMPHAKRVRLETDAEHKRELQRERARRYRDRKRGGPPRELKPCGTRAAKVRHERNGEECPECWPPISLIDVLRGSGEDT